MMKRTQQFLFVGSHPCLDFINTQMIMRGEPADVLQSSDDLLCWLNQADLLTQSQADVARTELSHNEKALLLERAKDFRTTLRSLAERIVADKRISDSTIKEINQFL